MAAPETPTEALEAPEPRDCEGCGQTDTHPRMWVLTPELVDGQLVVMDRPYHYDCLTPRQRRELQLDAGGQAGLDATAAGLRGADVQQAVYAAATAEQTQEA